MSPTEFIIIVSQRASKVKKEVVHQVSSRNVQWFREQFVSKSVSEWVLASRYRDILYLNFELSIPLMISLIYCVNFSTKEESLDK